MNDKLAIVGSDERSKVAVALFLVDLAARRTWAVAEGQSATATFKLGKTVVWEVWRSQKGAATLVSVRPHKPKETKRSKPR
ncbi:hypothetical protein F441_07154 [Phytophthora nicotianae CJ01A1]|uniref:Uncharacterized protein n=2 Tax=Phytophthora nicotianae TaxID=4792 RepID=V9FBR3_PHYNI|nr:hypothetical protein F443_07131 [Phytophthora nicotianae P1569]ETP18637.1 hypothetical protein F441_07154 [Phytophthora nicotianae CJ01A1]